MRPVDKGAAPKVYTNYRDAAHDLRSRLGDYCSYCERQIETHLAVEHIQPKSLVPELLNSWSNFLLSCVNCNSCKLDTTVNLPDYLWPDTDNTLRSLEYVRGGLIRPNLSLPEHIQNKAQAIIELTGLDKDPSNPGREPTLADLRWLRRQQVWQLAEKNRQILCNNNSPEVRGLIVENATSRGMFSIWWTVFESDLDMRQRLREAFIGTDQDSFDAREELKPRSGGQV